jgi:hypothetical protein
VAAGGGRAPRDEETPAATGPEAPTAGVVGSRVAELPARAVCRTGTAAVGRTPGLLARFVLGRGAYTSSGRRQFGTSGPIHGEQRQSLACIALVVSGGGR